MMKSWSTRPRRVHWYFLELRRNVVDYYLLESLSRTYLTFYSRPGRSVTDVFTSSLFLFL